MRNVKASSVHACMLGESYEVSILPVGETCLDIHPEQVNLLACESMRVPWFPCLIVDFNSLNTCDIYCCVSLVDRVKLRGQKVTDNL